MGTDYFSQGHYVIDAALVEKEAPTPWKLFMGEVASIAKEAGLSEESVLRYYAEGEAYGYDPEYLSEAQLDRLTFLHKDLIKEFKQSTRLDLYLGYVGEGLRGSDLHDEVFWALGNVMSKTKPAKMFEKKYGLVLTESVHQDCG